MGKIDTTPSTVATNALQAIPFGSLIGGPLTACVEAQSQAAKTSWEFIQEVGLTEDENGERKAIYVNFEYRKEGRSVSLSVPLLTLVPIPYLAIRDIDITFKANISAASSTSTTSKKTSETSFGTSVKAGFNLGVVSGSTQISASISSKKDSVATRDSKYSVEYTMDVAIKAGQDDMPAGMAKVLEMLNSSIDAIDRRGELQVSEQVLKMPKGGSVGLYATYKNAEGYYAPDQIRVMNDKNVAVGKDSCILTPDDPGALCMFSRSGTYQIVAGQRSIVVQVKELEEA